LGLKGFSETSSFQEKAYMQRLTVALLLAGCFGFQLWAQTPSSQQPVDQKPATDDASTGQAAPASEPTQFPWDQFKEFSAIMAGGPVPGTEDEIHIYRSGDRLRMEGREGLNYQITDLVKHETHGLAATGCLKYKSPYVRSYPFSLAMPDSTYERSLAGKETVDGHVCQIVDLTITFHSRPNTIKMKLWEAEDLQGFPVKIVTANHRTIQYKNVVLGPQDPSLFIFPNVCQGSVVQESSPKPKKAPATKSP
jgi:hypothetical protein